MRGRQGVNKLFLGITLLLLLGGLLIFMSASLGLLARPDTDSASGFATRQILEQIVAAFAGLFLMGWLSKFPYKKLKRWSLLIFFTTFALTALVFVPGIGEESGGGRRWIDAGPVSVQPVEFLKLGFVIYFAALLSSRKDRLGAFGGLTSLNAAAPATMAASIGANKGIYDSIGYGLGNILNPQPSLVDLLKQFGGLNQLSVA